VPANLSPEYKAAEESFRRAREPKERLECLREMLRTIPKHKGTDHLQADIKTRIRELTEELAGPRKGGARGGPETVIHPEGAAQIALLGPPNSGKSSLHARLTGSEAAVGSYPFTTQYPQPGMLRFEDIHFQLVDLPPIVPEHPIAWLANALQPADAAFLVIDLGDTDCIEQIKEVSRVLAGRRVILTGRWDGEVPEATLDDPFAVVLPTLLVVNQIDRLGDADGELEVFRELTGMDFPAIEVSAKTGAGLSGVGPWLFDALQVVRVYTKIPGHPADRDRPFTVRRGQTVADVARLVHRELVDSMKYARIWGRGHFDGQHVGRDQVVGDGDVVELHT